MNDLLQELIAEAVNGRIVIGEDYYNIGFNTVIRDGNENRIFSKEHDDLLFPTLIINNYNEFLYKITSYVDKAKDFYHEELIEKYGDYSDVEISKLLMSLVWSNATSTDFSNPVEYLDRRISFFDDKIDNILGFVDEISIFDNTMMQYDVCKSPLLLEAPYRLRLSLVNKEDGQSYILPYVYFGVSDDKAYIYSIQDIRRKDNAEQTKFSKMIRRRLNKVKKGFVSDINLDSMDFASVDEFNIQYPENMVSVDQSSLISLSTGLAIFEKMGIKEIVVPDFFPVRYNSSVIISELKSKKKEDAQSFLLEEDKNRERINRNIVDKKIRTFRRISSNFTNLDIYALPKEVDDSIHIKIRDNYSCNNEVLDEIYIKTSSQLKKDTGKKI